MNEPHAEPPIFAPDIEHPEGRESAKSGVKLSVIEAGAGEAEVDLDELVLAAGPPSRRPDAMKAPTHGVHADHGQRLRGESS